MGEIDSFITEEMGLVRDDGKIDAAVRVQRIEASILNILCNNIGVNSPNYMNIKKISDKTGHDYDTVVQHAVMLSRFEFGGDVQFDRMEDSIKIQRSKPSAILSTSHCSSPPHYRDVRTSTHSSVSIPIVQSTRHTRTRTSSHIPD